MGVKGPLEDLNRFLKKVESDGQFIEATKQKEEKRGRSEVKVDLRGSAENRRVSQDDQIPSPTLKEKKLHKKSSSKGLIDNAEGRLRSFTVATYTRQR